MTQYLPRLSLFLSFLFFPPLLLPPSSSHRRREDFHLFFFFRCSSNQARACSMYLQYVVQSTFGKEDSPTSNGRALNKLPTELRCGNFVDKHHRLSMQICAQTCKKTCAQRVHVPTELPLCMPPLVVGQSNQVFLGGMLAIDFSVLPPFPFSEASPRCSKLPTAKMEVRLYFFFTFK